MPTKKILVKGKVQGVYYRQSCREKAFELNISGEVRNLPDGSVELIATGTEAALAELLSWCKRGPVLASVSSVEMTDLQEQHFPDFRIVR